MTTKITWRNDDLAATELVEPMLDDMGFDNDEVREATKQFCLCFLACAVDLNMGDLQVYASCFAEGYEKHFSNRRYCV